MLSSSLPASSSERTCTFCSSLYDLPILAAGVGFDFGLGMPDSGSVYRWLLD